MQEVAPAAPARPPAWRQAVGLTVGRRRSVWARLADEGTRSAEADDFAQQQRRLGVVAGVEEDGIAGVGLGYGMSERRASA